MAVEVVERGPDPREHVYEVRCNKCNSKLRFKQADAVREVDDRDGNALVVVCPTCDNEIWVAKRTKYSFP